MAEEDISNKGFENEVSKCMWKACKLLTEQVFGYFKRYSLKTLLHLVAWEGKWKAGISPTIVTRIEYT